MSGAEKYRINSGGHWGGGGGGGGGQTEKIKAEVYVNQSKSLSDLQTLIN
jgi:hypothetical protein